MTSNRVQVAFIGGLLGAGKTTLLRSLAKHLTSQGNRVALITNDQTGHLVDTVFLRGEGLAVEEVAGSCFCCDFNGLVDSILTLLRTESPDIILAEPVGSCTDLQATVIRPMRDLMGEAVEVLPLSVLVDRSRLTDLDGVIRTDIPAAAESGALSLDYLLRQQLEEADVIALTKTDLLDSRGIRETILDLERSYPFASVLGLSARDDMGMDTLWRELQKPREPGAVLANIDYETYARAEAAMGWLNARLRVELPVDRTPESCLSDFVADVSASVHQQSGLIGNFKVIASDDSGWLRVGTVHAGQKPDVESGGFAGPNAEMTVNIRATLPAEELHTIIMQGARRWPLVVEHVDYLHPSPPNPTHRFA